MLRSHPWARPMHPKERWADPYSSIKTGPNWPNCASPTIPKWGPPCCGASLWIRAPLAGGLCGKEVAGHKNIRSRSFSSRPERPVTRGVAWQEGRGRSLSVAGLARSFTRLLVERRGVDPMWPRKGRTMVSHVRIQNVPLGGEEGVEVRRSQKGCRFLFWGERRSRRR